MSGVTTIRFAQGLFPALRERLLEGQDQETFALLLGKRISADGRTVIRVGEAVYPKPADYAGQSIASLRLQREFVYRELVRMQQEGRFDTVIDVHTHPFCSEGAAFSSVDDADEIAFHGWLNATLDEVGYASIVLSRGDYTAREWVRDGSASLALPARVRAQIIAEDWPNAGALPDEDELAKDLEDQQQGFLARSVLALGVDTLAGMMRNQTVGIVGVGGLGSVIAENLIHSGFQSLRLIDPDCLEITNLNRIVGATYADAVAGRCKASAVKEHLLRINPKARVRDYITGIQDAALLPVLMECDWLIVATDSHSSRFHTQRIALELGIPLISAGVNISVESGVVTDMSGEVIIARYGDGLCLNCLGRINPTALAAEAHAGDEITRTLVARGYVTGAEVKEPAVKTLNAIVGAMAVDALVNQFAWLREHQAITVYESVPRPAMYADEESVAARSGECYACN
jgi:molybdopterin/thiamine biosynthesis adenylyltransferase